MPQLGDENTVFAKNSEYSSSFAEKKIPTYDELIAKPDISVVDIRGEGQGRFAEQRKAFVTSEAKRICETPVVNRDTGEAVFITPATFTHSFSNRGAEQIGAVKNIREIVENAVLTHAEPSYRSGDNTTGVYTLFGAVKTDAGIRPVRLKVKEYRLVGQDIPENIKAYLAEGEEQNTFAKAYDGRVLVLDADIKIEPDGSEKSNRVSGREQLPSGLEGTSSSAATMATRDVAVNHPSVPSNISVKDLIDLVNSSYRKYLPVNQDIIPKLDGGQMSIGRSFSELVQNQRDGVELGDSGQFSMTGFPELRSLQKEEASAGDRSGTCGRGRELHHAENGGCGRQRDRR